ncbi:DUF3313 family protein [Aquidulcibacter sp.]|uniref:DUF3313 family protein n=1 Tax=Aquidulcibacter sp. TaxID=2052990 RepID=UPI0025BED7B6|nr:DUF3313 family protein [Aquidulcibacter sp.]MCA3693172.1 DUF3313 domain-containing protein [Aquidulcibacter sp.]
MQRSSLRKFVPTLLGSLTLFGCTTMPSANSSFLKSQDRLVVKKGLRTQQLVTQPPSPAIEQGSKLKIDSVEFVRNAQISANLTPVERELIENVLAREICADLSDRFDIVADPSDANVYQLRIGIQRLESTSKLSAGIATVTGFATPIGLRPPLGLGSLTVEFELLNPQGQQTAAMVWSKKADIGSNQASVSRIGDAYRFAKESSSDFARLVLTPDPSQPIVSPKNGSKGPPDLACDPFGKKESFLTGLVGQILPLPPEYIDEGRKP